MRTVWILAWFEVRRRWRGAALLTVVVGIVGAVVLVTLAGARRTESSLRRFDDSSRSSDVSLLPAFGYSPTPSEIAALRRVHDVVAVGELRSLAVLPTNAPATLGIAAARDGSVGSVIDRARLVKGRQPSAASTEEVAISESLAQTMHQGVGGHLDAVFFTPEQVRAAAANGAPPPMNQGHPISWAIVGIVRRPLDLGTLATQGGVVVLTPAFDRANARRIGSFGAIIRVRTAHGATDVPGVVAAATRIFRSSGPVSAQGAQTEIVGAQGAVDVLTLALRIYAGVLALAALIAIAIMLSRDIILANDERDTLRALGVTRAQGFMAHGPRALLIATVGALLAVVGAILGSPLLPTGIARKADPDPGFHADWRVLLPGAGVVIVIVIAIAVMAALLDAHQPAGPRPRRARGVVDRTSTWLSPTSAVGLRMALQAGRGRSAVPVRSACFGAIFGVLGFVAVLVFGASLDQLVTTPAEYGSTWSFTLADTAFNPTTPRCGTQSLGVTAIGGIGALAAICDNDVQLEGRPLTAWGITPVRGSLMPTIIEGRSPHNADEVALGAKTLEALHKRVGETVHGHNQHGTVTFRIVGQVVMPTLAYPQPLADGAVFTGPGLMRVYDGNSRASRSFVGRFTPHANTRAVARDLAHLTGVGPLTRPTTPTEIERVNNVSWIPTALAAVLGLLALIAIAHALVVTVGRRRHDLGILRTLGFSRTQTRSTIAWQATVLAAIGLAGGVPLGITTGRIAWRLVADGLGVSTISAIPIAAIVLLVPAVVALANAIAFLPGRAAANISPAVALRSE